MNDKFDEESKVAREQDSDGTALNSDSFLHPIKELRLPKVIGLDQGTTLKAAIGLMQEKKIGSIVVTDKDELVGIFTERDVLMRVIGILSDWESKTLASVMTTDPQSLMEHDEIAYVLNNMHVGGYRHIPIVDEKDHPVSMVSIKDVVSWIMEHFPGEILNLTGEPFRGPTNRDVGG
jgi:CBS domain-containing protein